MQFRNKQQNLWYAFNISLHTHACFQRSYTCSTTRWKQGYLLYAWLPVFCWYTVHGWIRVKWNPVMLQTLMLHLLLKQQKSMRDILISFLCFVSILRSSTPANFHICTWTVWNWNSSLWQHIFGKLTYSCTVKLFNLNFTVSLLPSPWHEKWREILHLCLLP